MLLREVRTMAMMQDRAADWMAAPVWWLVSGLEWPGGDWAEGAAATSPDIARRLSPVIGGKPAPISRDLEKILMVGDEFAAERGVRVVMFSDLTVWISERHGKNWSALGVDWEWALREMRDRSPVLCLTIHESAYLLLTDTVLGEMTKYNLTTGTVTVATRAERDVDREEMRAGFLVTLEADWPPYIQRERERGILPAEA
jgi:hypothetical protein